MTINHLPHKCKQGIPILNLVRAEKLIFIVQSSRAQILKQATDYISMMSRKNAAHQYDIDELKHQNSSLESQGMYHA